MPTSCLIVDDQRSFLRAAKSVLEADGLDVVGVADSVDEAMRLAAELRPDVVLVDIDLADESGLELASRLATGADAIDVVLISTHGEEDFAELIEASPAIGFLPKTELSAGAVNALVQRAGSA
ncbi:MAG TPA: response regulator transcription factor [Thermoleophilaceae bacterium]